MHLSPSCFHIHGTVPLQLKSDHLIQYQVWGPCFELNCQCESPRDNVLTRHPHYHKHPKSTKWQKKLISANIKFICIRKRLSHVRVWLHHITTTGSIHESWPSTSHEITCLVVWETSPWQTFPDPCFQPKRHWVISIDYYNKSRALFHVYSGCSQFVLPGWLSHRYLIQSFSISVRMTIWQTTTHVHFKYMWL